MIALLYDVHGNAPALEAVVADARAAGVTEWLVGGDVALFGAYPAETIAALRALEPARWLRGNTDRWMAFPAEAPDAEPPRGGVAAALEVVDADEVAALGRLPESLPLGDGGRAWHASPAGDVLSFLPQPAPTDDEHLAGTTDRRLVFGHTHLQFRRMHGETELVNPGSVGMPLDGDRRAAYALLHDDDTIEFRRVAYDADAVLAALRDRFAGEWVGTVAARLESARP